MENNVKNITMSKPEEVSAAAPASASALADIFKPEENSITLGGVEYNILYDMNSFIELEKIYGSVDRVIQLVLGVTNSSEPVVTYNGGKVRIEEIAVDGVPLANIIEKQRAINATQADTLNILYAGLMHDLAEFNNEGEITGYRVSKSQIGSCITFKNIREVNRKIVIGILRDLVPSEEQLKNETAPKETK